jgi:hypothetical protein
MRKDKLTSGKVIILAVVTTIIALCDSPSRDTLVRQCAVPLLPLIGLGLSLASAGASAGVAGAQAKKAKAEQDAAQRQLDDWYQNEMAGNILDRADTRSMLAEYRNSVKEQNEKYLNNAIKGGATDEAKVAFNESMNQGYANAISRIMAQGQARKDSVADSYMRGKMDYHNNLADMYMQTGKQMGDAISSAGNAMSTAISGADLGSIGKGGKYLPPK